MTQTPDEPMGGSGQRGDIATTMVLLRRGRRPAG